MKLRNLNRCLLAGVALLGFNQFAQAELCPGVQKIKLTYDAKELDNWSGVSSAVRKISLPNGFVLGMKIEQGAREVYERSMESTGQPWPELVKITLYDYTSTQPRYLTSTWGGSNSLQGYGPKGGADRVDELGGNGIVLQLEKPACTISKTDLAALPAEKDLGQTKEIFVPDEKTLQWMQAAKEDIARNKYVVTLYQDSIPEKIATRLAQLLEKDGIQLELMQKGSQHDAKAYLLGYGKTMQQAIEARFGKQHGRDIEKQLKAEFN